MSFMLALGVVEEKRPEWGPWAEEVLGEWMLLDGGGKNGVGWEYNCEASQEDLEKSQIRGLDLVLILIHRARKVEAPWLKKLRTLGIV